MLSSDIEKYKIKNISVEEIVSTGANLRDVNIKLILNLEKLTKLTNTKTYLLKNGITSGKHRPNSYHYQKKAVDIYTAYKDLAYLMHIICTETDFKGIGFYINEINVVSIHLDLRSKFCTWCARKFKKGDRWEYRYYPEAFL